MPVVELPVKGSTTFDGVLRGSGEVMWGKESDITAPAQLSHVAVRSFPHRHLKRFAMRTIAQMSDLHFGRHDLTVMEDLLTSVNDNRPDLVALSGDFTQRARHAEFAEARRFLDRISQPKLLVPGNHDVPLYNMFARFLTPFARYDHYVLPVGHPAGLYFVWLPAHASWLATFAGIGRGVDLILYVWLVISLIMFLDLHSSCGRRPRSSPHSRAR
jgi:hypothetical protein